MKYNLWILITFAILLVACEKQPPRKPVSYASGEYIKNSVQRNKELVSEEENDIQKFIKNDSLRKYYEAEQGFWYTYIKAYTEDTPKVLPGDMVDMTYDVKDLKGNVIYTQAETQPKIYIADKQEIIPGIRHGVKLMKKGETVQFLFPSTLAYGYLGDKNKIGTNFPLIINVTINDIKKQ